MARFPVLLSFASIATAYCPWYGPVFPPPKGLASSATFKSALESLKSAYDTGIGAGNSSTGLIPSSSTVGLQLFSTDSEKALFEYYHDGTVLNSTAGVKTLDGDSVIRVASISKLLTVYMLLKELGDGLWNIPINQIIPELKGEDQWKDNEVDYVNWNEVTMGTLAGQISGISADFIVVENINPFFKRPEAVAQLRLPPLEPSEEPACTLTAEGVSCTREEFFKRFHTRQPVRHPNSSPGYSSTAYIILGYALESITGRPFEQSLKLMSDALKLSSTTVTAPDISKIAVLVDVPSSVLVSLGSFDPTGGVFSSLNDLTRVGKSILQSTLIPQNTTRGWLKPTTFTSDTRSAVGRPWEIYRVDTKTPRGVIDIYTKGGDIGLYHTKIVLVPDYNVGAVMLVGGDGDKNWLIDQIINLVLPALEEVAREEADAAYAGTYTSNADGIETTITLSTKSKEPGLFVDKWTRNGTDILDALSGIIKNPVNADTFRLLPTGLERTVGDGKEVSWRALRSLTSYPTDGKGSVFSACPSWFNIEGGAYGPHTVDQMLFTLGSDGKAANLNLRAWKTDLKRTD